MLVHSKYANRVICFSFVMFFFSFEGLSYYFVPFIIFSIPVSCFYPRFLFQFLLTRRYFGKLYSIFAASSKSSARVHHRDLQCHTNEIKKQLNQNQCRTLFAYRACRQNSSCGKKGLLWWCY